MPLNFNIKTTRADNGRGRCLGIMGLARILAGIVFLILLKEDQVQAGQSVTLSWQPSPNPDAMGYNIYYGTGSHYYTNVVNVGNITLLTIDGLVNGATYYFAATTYDTQGQESGFSNEAAYEVPAVVITNVLPTVQIRSAPAGQFLLTITGLVNQSYDIEATEDFSVWTVIGTVVIGTGGSLDFADVNAASFSQRFYRTHEIP
jgi:Fibronectin type III domain